MANIKTVTEIPYWFTRLTEGDGVPDDNISLFRKVPYFYRAVQLRCDALSGVPIKVYKGEDEVDWPYPTSIQSLIWRWEASLALKGAAYGEIVANQSGYKKDVQYRNPFDMYVEYKPKDGILVIKQNQSGAVWKNKIYEGSYEMVYIAEYDPAQDILPGIGSGNASNVDAKLLYSLSKFPEAYFEGGAMPVTVVGVDTTDQSEIERTETFFKKMATGLKNAFRVLGVRTGSIDVKTITPPMKDLAMPEISDEAKHNIAVAFGIPKTMMDSEAANYATAQEDRKGFYEETLKPRARMYEAALNEQLLDRDGMRIEFAFDELEIFQEDENNRADRLLSFVQAGLPTRLAIDLAGIDMTDEQAAMLATEAVDNGADEGPDAVDQELGKWMRMVEKRVKENKAIRDFETDVIPDSMKAAIDGALDTVKTVEDVRAVFESVKGWRDYP